MHIYTSDDVYEILRVRLLTEACWAGVEWSGKFEREGMRCDGMLLLLPSMHQAGPQAQAQIPGYKPHYFLDNNKS